MYFFKVSQFIQRDQEEQDSQGLSILRSLGVLYLMSVYFKHFVMSARARGQKAMSVRESKER